MGCQPSAIGQLIGQFNPVYMKQGKWYVAYAEESHRMGTLQDILREEGFVSRDAAGSNWSPPPLIATEHMQLTF